MALPELIEIVPLDQPVRAEITVPGSKSITNRALILAALADGEVTLTGALWSEDTQIMVECLQKLGFEIRVEKDPAEFCNRTITVKGLGGKIPNSGTAEKPLELFVGNAGTAARFLSAFVCLGDGVYRLSGVARMHERPQAALFPALRELGYRVESENGNDKLPVEIFCSSRHESAQNETEIFNQSRLTSAATVSIEESSQFASALLLCAKVGNWKVEVVGENADESPYVAMTLKLIEAFPKNGGAFQIEPDASSGSYFWAINDWEDILNSLNPDSDLHDTTDLCDWKFRVHSWPNSGFQVDANFPKTLKILSVLQKPPSDDIALENRIAIAIVSRVASLGDTNPHLGDSIMTAIVVTPIFSKIQIQYMHLGRLRVQETERVFALKTELAKCGAKVEEDERNDVLMVFPSQIHGAEIETYNDHRMAMCFAILGLKVPGMKIKNPACVKKTFPNFFQKLAAQPPHGLGATILDAKSGRKLTHEELFAD